MSCKGESGQSADALYARTRSRQRLSYPREELGLVTGACYLHALEVVGEPDIGVEVSEILVEVQERARATREVAALALPQLGQPSKLGEQLLKAIKVFLRRVSHRLSMTATRSPTQEWARADRARGLTVSAVVAGAGPVDPRPVVQLRRAV